MRQTKFGHVILLSCAYLFADVTTALAVEISTRQYDSHNGDIYQTVDGTIFKKTGFGFVGFLGFHQEIIFLSGEEICMNGSKYKIKVFEVGPSTHYSIDTYEGADAYAKVEEICGELP